MSSPGSSSQNPDGVTPVPCSPDSAGAVVFWAVFVAPRGSVAPILGWIGAGICALTSVTFFVLVVSPPTLDLDDAGFGIGNPLHRWRFRWTDVGPFVTGPSNVGAAPRTVVYFDIDASVRSRPGGRVRRLNRRLTGHDFAIPHTYGQDVYELAALLNASRDHALTGILRARSVLRRETFAPVAPWRHSLIQVGPPTTRTTSSRHPRRVLQPRKRGSLALVA